MKNGESLKILDTLFQHPGRFLFFPRYFGAVMNILIRRDETKDTMSYKKGMHLLTFDQHLHSRAKMVMIQAQFWGAVIINRLESVGPNTTHPPIPCGKRSKIVKHARRRTNQIQNA